MTLRIVSRFIICFLLALFITNCTQPTPSLPEPLYLHSLKNETILSFCLTTEGHLLFLSVRKIDHKEGVFTLIKIDSRGKILFEKTWRLSSPHGGRPQLAPQPNDGCIVAFHQMWRVKLLGLDKDANELWRWEAKPSDKAQLQALSTTEKGETLFLLDTQDSMYKSQVSQDLFCLTPEGQEKWRKTQHFYKQQSYFIKVQDDTPFVFGIRRNEPHVQPSAEPKDWWTLYCNEKEIKTLDKYIWDIALDQKLKGGFYITSWSKKDTFYLRHIDPTNEKKSQVISTLLQESTYQFHKTKGILWLRSLMTSESTFLFLEDPICSRRPMALESLPDGGVALLDGCFSVRLRLIDSQGKIRACAESYGRGIAISEAFFYDAKRNKIHIIGQSTSEESSLTPFWIQVSVNELLKNQP